MIKYLAQDILTVNADCILHVCNCFHTMGAGVALTLKNRYPVAYAADKKTPHGDAKKMGTFSVGKDASGVWVYNMYAQYYYGRDRRQLNYEALYNALCAVRIDVEQHDRKIIVLPYYMGCKNAGGNWNIVITMIQEVWKNSDVTVYVAGS
jgi:O-acetyl-ADP-ribose deacetylase (regulator of RNase III)